MFHSMRFDKVVRLIIIPAALIVLAVTVFPTGAAESYRVIVNSASGVSTLTAKDVSAYFLKIKTHWGSGAKIVPVDLAADAEARKKFSEDVHRRSVAAVNAYWQQQIFSGRSLPPLELKDDTAVIAFVKANPDAIGYVSSSANITEVKVVDVTGIK